MEPARSIVKSLGGPTLVAAEFGLSTGAVVRWYKSAEKGGCGGLIPSNRIPALCRMARTQKRFLEPNMFFEGHV
jgi:hypothetical protein